MTCINCGSTIDKTDKYCRVCGNKIVSQRLNIRDLFIASLYQFFNFDNKFFKTFLDLLAKPAKVIDGYVNGNRKRYLNPFNYFALALSISGLQILIIRNFFIDTIKFTSFNGEAGSEISRRIMELSFDYQPLLFAIQIPILAGISYLIFRRNHYNFSEHFILFTYTQCEYSILTFPINFLILIIAPTVFSSVGLLLTFFILVYSLYVLFNLFKTSLKNRIIKSILFIMLYLVVFNLIFFIVGLVLFRLKLI
ncbi:DUF3667 domain-containing protein [Spongiivirga sp. MCCC 1A20706]|uniref:DUF3667 domain-containing protein n=1 Tax=Spongiivirga sp. MCCC 1A20706 TaxID=3160963 RepID=UPI003977A611